MSKEKAPFVIEQLEEALEERQKPDRRQQRDSNGIKPHEDRRKEDRRNSAGGSH